MRYLTLILSSLLMSPLAHSQTIVSESPESYEINVPRGMGLGQIVRTLNKDPDWVDRNWIAEIQKANAEVIQTSGEITKSKVNIVIPKAAIAQLKPLNQTVATGKASAPAPEKVAVQPEVQEKPHEKIQGQEEPKPKAKPAEKVAQPTSGAATYRVSKSIKSEMPKPNRSKIQMTVLTAFEGIEAEATTGGTKADLKPKAGYGVSIGSTIAMGQNYGLRLNATWMNLSYEEPSGVDVEQDSSDNFEAVLGVEAKASNRWLVYIDGLYKQQNYLQLTMANQVEIENLAIPGARVGVGASLYENSSWTTQLNVSYSHLFARDSGSLEIEDGSEVEVELEFLQRKGFGLELSYTRKDQDTNITKHSYDLGKLGVTYTF